MLGAFVLSGGEDNLSFRVFDGTSAPASPKERDIWVNTSTAITSWDFSPTQPLRRSSNSNLLVYPYRSGASLVTNGVTYTCNSSGHVTASGTATANAYYRVHNDTAGVMYLEPGTYTLSGCPAQPGSGNSYHLYLYDIDNGRTLGSDYGSGVSVTLTSRTHVSVNISVLNGKTASSAVFKPKLEKAAVATSYVKGDATGQVWFKTGDTGDASLNALNENGIWLNISGAKQYVDGAWTEVPSKVYLNGAWVELDLPVYIYQNGTSFVGSWTIVDSSYENSTVRFNANSISFQAGGSDSAGHWAGYARVAVSDIGEYDTLNLSYSDLTFGGTGTSYLVLGLSSNENAYVDVEGTISDAISQTKLKITSTIMDSNGVLTLDLSAVTANAGTLVIGSVASGLNGSRTGTINEIWFD